MLNFEYSSYSLDDEILQLASSCKLRSCTMDPNRPYDADHPYDDIEPIESSIHVQSPPDTFNSRGNTVNPQGISDASRHGAELQETKQYNYRRHRGSSSASSSASPPRYKTEGETHFGIPPSSNQDPRNPQATMSHAYHPFETTPLPSQPLPTQQRFSSAFQDYGHAYYENQAQYSSSSSQQDASPLGYKEAAHVSPQTSTLTVAPGLALNPRRSQRHSYGETTQQPLPQFTPPETLMSRHIRLTPMGATNVHQPTLPTESFGLSSSSSGQLAEMKPTPRSAGKKRKQTIKRESFTPSVLAKESRKKANHGKRKTAPSASILKAPSPQAKAARESRINKRRPWTKDEDACLQAAVEKYHGTNWKAIADMVPTRTHVQCLQRWRKSLHPDVVKGRWSPEEDAELLKIVKDNPHIKNWGHAARYIPGRTAKQCRERYTNHLDPNIEKGNWSIQEDQFIAEGHKTLGNKWAEIASHLPGRTENSVKIRAKCIKRKEAKKKKQQEKLLKKQQAAAEAKQKQGSKTKSKKKPPRKK